MFLQRFIFFLSFLVSFYKFNSQCDFYIYPDSINEICFQENLNLFIQSDSVLNYSWSPSSYISNNVGDSVNFYSPNPGSYNIMVVGSSNNCSDSILIEITVLEPFVVGNIIGADTLCRYYTPDTLIQNIFTSGGQGDYEYQWLSSTDSLLWTEINGANSANYIPLGISQNLYFSLLVNDVCGSDTTNVIFDSIIPSPEYLSIIGDSLFCSNESDVLFSVIETQLNIDYLWGVNGGVIFQQLNDSTIIVDLDSNSGTANIELLMIHDSTGCDLGITKDIIKSSNLSPERTSIIRKPNSNILICDDSSYNIQYQWGFTNKSNAVDYEINPGGDLRYVLLPHVFDSTIYKYWVRTSYNYGLADNCETISYLNNDLLTSTVLINESNLFFPFPNPNSGVFSIKELKNSEIFIYNSLGMLISTDYVKSNDILIFDITNHPSGVYFLSVCSALKNSTYLVIKN